MSRRTRTVAVSFTIVLAAWPVSGAMIAPPSDLGDLALQSAVVVEAQAIDSWSEPGAYVPHTVTRFAVVERVSGVELPDSFLVSVPGGSAGELAAMVPGAPRFVAGNVYLLFLDPGRDGLWRVRTMAYGVFERVELEGTRYLRPVPEREQVGFVGGRDAEVPGVLREGALVPHLRNVVRGAEAWDGRKVAASPEIATRLTTKDAPGACRFMEWSSGDGLPIRWFDFDSGGQATIYAGTPGQSGLTDGGTAAVSGGAGAWTNDSGSLISLQYGGTTSTAISCSSGDDSQNGAVVFDDPCDDISDLSGCSGTLAYGGPVFYTSTQEFDGQQWHPAVDLFVVVNDGSECLGDTNFAEMITHELGHGLGFGHHADSQATMYAYCCHYPRGAGLSATDSSCAAYLYPDGSAPDTPSAPSNLQATAVSETRIDLAWTDTADNEDGFRVYRDVGSGYARIATVGANQQTYADGSLSMCSTAQYVVRAYNGDGESGASNADGATTDGTAPETPTALTASATGPDRVDLTWSNGSVAQDTVRIDRAVRTGSFGFLANVDGGATSYADGAVIAGTTYHYRVRAENGCGASGYSGEASATVPSEEEPLEAEFDWAPAAPWTGESVTFTAEANGEPESYEWTLGDGASGSGQQVGHIYGAPGSYTVRLTVHRGGDSASVAHSVGVSAAPSLVAAAAKTPGANGTSWRTDMAVLNPSPSTVSGSVVLRTAGGGSGGFTTLTVGPRSLVSLDDVVSEMGTTGTGALQLSFSALDELCVMTRTYTGQSGTLGQAIPLEAAVRPGTVYVTGLHGSPEFRTNFGIASAAGATAHVSLTLYRQDGAVSGPTLDIPANGQAQWPVESLFGAPVLGGTDEATLAVETDQPIVAYISVVDEVSGDPVYVSARQPSTDWLVPVVGRGSGQGGTWWDSELVLFNRSDASTGVDLEYLPADASNAAGGQTRHLVLGPRETRRIRQVQASLWDVSGGLGSVVVSASAPVLVEARVATPRPNGEGSMGQRILPVDLNRSDGESGVVPWVREGAAFRSNIGLFNRSAAARTVTLGLRGENGALLEQTEVPVGARSLVQRSVDWLFGPGALPAGEDGWIDVLSDPDALVVYGSQVDNVSGDPVYVPGA